MDSDEGEYEQMMLGSAPGHVGGGGSGRPYLSTSLPTGSHLYSSYDGGEEVPHVPLPKKLYPPPPHPSAASSSSAGATTQGLATSNSTPSTSSSSSSAATHFPSTSSSFYSGPNLGRLSPRFSLPSSYVGAYPSPVSLHTNAAQPQFSSLLSVISNKAPTFVEHHGGGSGGGGGGGSGGVGTTASHRPPRDRDREGSSKVEAKEAREREKLDKKERKKWNKLKNRTLGDSTSPTNSITSTASLASPSGVGAKGGTIEVPRRPDRVPPPQQQQQLDPRGGEAGGLDAATIARRTTAAAIAAAAASVANGGAAQGGDSTSHHHGAGYSFSPAHMEEAGGAPHTTHRYRSPSVVKRPSKGKALLISRLSSNALGLYDSSSAVAVPAPSSGGASSPYAAEQAHSGPDLESSSSPWTDAVIKLNIGGVKYTTSRTTLMRLPNTYFSVLLSGKFPAIRDHEGAFFIDRDGRLFDPILSFLRTNHLKIPEGLSLEEVLGEMEFYGMTELSEHIASSMVSSHPGYKYFMCQLPRPEASLLDDRPARKAKRDKQKKKDKQPQQQQQQPQQQQQVPPADGKKTPDNPSSSSSSSAASSSTASSSASPSVAGPNGGGGGSVAGVSISVSGPGSNGDISVVGSSAAPVAPVSAAPAAPSSAPISAPPPSGLGAGGGNSGSGSGTSGSGAKKAAAAAAAEERGKEKDNDEEQQQQQQRETAAAAASLEASGAWLRREHAHSKVTQLCSKFNIVCAAYEDGSIACWKYENMALGWRLMFMESQCLPTADGLIMSATMTTTGQYTNLYLAVYSKKSALVCVWDQLHLKSGVKWGELQLELKDIISCNFMVNNCYLVAMSTDNSICIFDLREPPERNKIIYMCAPSHAISPSPSSFGPSSPRAPRELSARSMELSKKDRVMCVAVVDPFSFLGFDDGTICELAQHFNSHTHWEWVVAETWEDIDKEVITCLSCVVFTDRHGSNVLLTYGTEQGSVRLCSKVVNTRNFKLIFSAKGHHDQPINQVMISESHKSGGGLIFSSLSAGGTIKVWRYLYVDLPQPHVSCIACYNSGGSIDHFIYNSGLMQDMLTQMVFLERNLENIDGKEIDGRVESHLCVITNAENALTIYDDYYCVCSIKPVDGSSVTSCCVVSYDDLAAPKPYVRNQFITGHDNGTLQVWDLDLAFHHNKLSSHPYHHPYSFYPFYYAFHHSHGVSHPIKTTFK